MAEELEPKAAAVGGEENPQSTGESAEERQPQDQGTPDLSKLNLDDLPQFRNWKSETDKRLGFMQRQAAEERERRERLEQQYHQAQMAGLGDVERVKYENQLLQARLQEVETQRQLDIRNFQRDKDIAEVANKLGLSRRELEEALPPGADAYQLWDTALELSKKAPSTKRPDPVRQAANTVDLGGSKPSGGASEKYRQMLEQARKDYDFGRIMDVQAEAAKEGIYLE